MPPTQFGPRARCSRVVAAICFCGLLTASVRGLDPARKITQYSHRIWTADNGLPQSSVQAILQTRDGYLWIGTQEGLARFDGVRFTVYDRSTTGLLRSDYINVLFEDREGAVWIGTNGGGLTRMLNGRFTTVAGLTSGIVTSLVEDRVALWIGTDGGGLFRLQKGRLARYGRAHGLASDHVSAIAKDGLGGLWIATAAGLHHLQGGTFTVYTTRDGLSSNRVSAVYPGRDGTLWVGTTGGIDRRRDGAFTSYRKEQGLSHNAVTSILEDRDGSLWIGTDGGGLNRFRDGQFTVHDSAAGLSHDLVWALLEDREGSLWIGTDGGGLNQLRDGAVTPYGTREGLSSDATWAVSEDRAGSLWIGTYGGGLNRVHGGTTQAYTRRDGLADDIVWSLFEDRASDLWVGTDTGLSRLRGRTFETYTPKDGLPEGSVRAILEDRRGALWVGTDGGGLGRFEGGKFTSFTTKDGLSNASIRAILEDRQGTLWVGTYGGGLNRLRDGEWSSLTTRQGLSSDIIYSLHEDEKGALWIGTSGGGLNRLQDGRLTVFTRKQGLFDDVVFQILEDAHGSLWMSCNRGFFRVRKSELNDLARGAISSVTSVAYAKADGMRSPECNAGQPAGVVRKDGTVWFATMKGLASIDPTAVRRNERAPSLVIEEFLVDGVAMDPTIRPTIPPRRNRLEFRYTAPSLLVPERIRFRYRLEGFDREWVEAGDRRIASYTNVPPGPYRFRVTACNENGIWNPRGRVFEFSLTPTIYQTAWFPVLCVAAAVLTGTGGYLRHARRLRAREAELSRLVRERTRLLEEANKRLAELSAQDGLTGIANRRRFDEVIGLEWRRAVRTGSTMSVILIDIDNFKEFNDAYGHAAGDECLKRVAHALVGGLRRAGDLVARYGGEEFAVVLPSSYGGTAITIAHRLREAVEELGIPHGASPVLPVITISLGVASAVPNEKMSPDLFLAAADRALYRAKRDGRNCVRAAERAGPEPAA